MMHPTHLKLTALAVLTMSSFSAAAIPFTSFDPRSVAMGTAGVALADPSTAPFFNPALLSVTDPSKRYSVELPVVGVRLYDPEKLRDEIPKLGDKGTALQDSVTPFQTSSTLLQTNTNVLAASISTLTTDIASVPSTVDATTISALPTTLGKASTSLGKVATNMTTVSGDMTTVSGDMTSVKTNVDALNTSLQNLNAKPMQGEFGGAIVVGIPRPDYGFAFFAGTSAALGGALEYNDAANVQSVSDAISTASTSLTSSSAAVGTKTNATTSAGLVEVASVKLAAASTACDVAGLSPQAAAQAVASCNTSLTAAKTALDAANTSLATTKTTLDANAKNATDASTTATNNKKMTSKIHLRGVVVSEAGASIAHKVVVSGQEFVVGVSPKVMNLQLFDALLDADSGSSSDTMGSDNSAQYTTGNFDLGVAKSYPSGWRTGLVVKNVVPQTFDFKRAPTPGATPVATGATLKLSPQVRTGVSYERTDRFAVALDVDLTANDPAGLESKSQYVSLGGELSAWGWAQLRAGYRADLGNTARNVASVGLGLSPRIPYFKLHTDIAVLGNANEVGAALKLGVNF